MSRLIIVEPMKIASVVATRGTGVDNLVTADPKEVWADEVGATSTLTIDLGTLRTIDTIFLGHMLPPAAAATWSIDIDGTVVLATSPLRVPDVVGTFPAMSHALWQGEPQAARMVTLQIAQPVTSLPLTAGTLVIGKAFIPDLGQEWGGGRQPIDTGTATPLPSGGFAIVEGVRKRRMSWTFGDLSTAETDRLEALALALGETKPGLVVEDAALTAGLRARIFYGRFERWRQFERRNRAQTRWEIGIEEWA